MNILLLRMKTLGFTFIITMLLFSSCKREQAIWETDWQLPIVTDSLTLNQLVEDSILTVSSGYYELSLNRTIFELKLSDFVDIPDTLVNHTYVLPVSNFNVQPGSSFVNDAKEHIIDLGDVELKKVRVKSGGIRLKVLSPIETKTFFTVQLPGVTKNGQLLSQNFTAPAGTNAAPSAVDGFVDLSGYELDLRGASQGSFNRLQSKLLVTTDPNGPMVSVNFYDTMKFVFEMQDIKLEYARGYFGQQNFSDQVTETIEALEKITSGGIDLDAASLGLTIENGLKVSAKLRLNQLLSTNQQGTAVSLSHPSIGSWETINAAVGTEANLTPSVLNLNFNSGNSNLESYLENHGAKNDISYDLQLNPWGNVSGGFDEIFDAHPLKVNLSGDLPLNVGLNSLILEDTFDFSINQDPLKTNIKSGFLWLRATNAFPIQGQITLYLLDKNGNQITAITSVNPVSSSVYGTVINGIQQKQSYLQFEVPESIVDQLSSVAQCVVKLNLNTPDANSNNSVQQAIPVNAFFAFKLGAKLVIENRL